MSDYRGFPWGYLFHFVEVVRELKLKNIVALSVTSRISYKLYGNVGIILYRILHRNSSYVIIKKKLIIA